MNENLCQSFEHICSVYSQMTIDIKRVNELHFLLRPFLQFSVTKTQKTTLDQLLNG